MKRFGHYSGLAVFLLGLLSAMGCAGGAGRLPSGGDYLNVNEDDSTGDNDQDPLVDPDVPVVDPNVSVVDPDVPVADPSLPVVDTDGSGNDNAANDGVGGDPNPPTDESDFTPATGADSDGAPPNAPVEYGPWNVRLRVATSPDGRNWTRTGVTVTDQGDVPSVLNADGKLWLFYVIWKDANETPDLMNATVAAYSSDLVNWTFKQVHFAGGFPTGYTTNPVDPTVVAVDGGYRMYFTLGPTEPTPGEKAHTFSAFSTDLLNWTYEGSRFEVNGADVLDPSLVWVGDHYEFFAGSHHATSPDGLIWTFEGDYSPENLILSNGARVGDAYQYYAFYDVQGETGKYVRSLRWDGGAWAVDDGIRLSVDTSTGDEIGMVRDPAVSVHPAGESQGYVMVYVTGIP